MTRTEAHRKPRLAAGLEHHQPLHDALASGDLLVDQARMIIKAVDDLPYHVHPALVVEAERHLVEQAAHFDAVALRRLGRGLLHVIDPEAADAHRAKLLEREEREAATATRLTMRESEDGITRGTFALPARHAHMLRKQLLASAAPKHRAAVDGAVGERRPGPQRLGQALCEWIERYPTDELRVVGRARPPRAARADRRAPPARRRSRRDLSLGRLRALARHPSTCGAVTEEGQRERSAWCQA